MPGKLGAMNLDPAKMASAGMAPGKDWRESVSTELSLTMDRLVDIRPIDIKTVDILTGGKLSSIKVANIDPKYWPVRSSSRREGNGF